MKIIYTSLPSELCLWMDFCLCAHFCRLASAIEDHLLDGTGQFEDSLLSPIYPCTPLSCEYNLPWVATCPKESSFAIFSRELVRL